MNKNEENAGVFEDTMEPLPKHRFFWSWEPTYLSIVGSSVTPEDLQKGR